MKSNGFLVTLGFYLLAASGWIVVVLAGPNPYERSLCQEVDHELGESVRSGLLKPEEAGLISQRCYERFGGYTND